ncbi:hypothetical protein BASA50_002119 [Batrachochytrium salamandrivorans]|uniref:Isochorismatase-like domain-containing protein n=1 Tax=Batrachochytrium salamandrivorans TaxID=1357716 RepID=A0ABQ8FM78_9FUNG|nr:hypothetical protein BASA60_010978 [Batrachochytrium salamandrivorans]KAH6569537.1 hypothetical protein BASA62_004810 [Batrachochytrium salamandrivorans]KAH6595407.1 hypothetical protein BASA61_003819 [Batrachochytrium salamandrivorans]KAH6600659.1 hypothetical protein BASA50_002119 [Batrachochytrium salamandrivorans]KAH9276119.1 hypothetical protein BASA83_001392 [Batrachochytrium salamandrivorans]
MFATILNTARQPTTAVMSTGVCTRSISKLVTPLPQSTAFFLCDVQERFRPHIWQYPHVIATASKMVQASKILNIPLIVTEHVPKTFGSTVPELDISTAFCCLPKTKFSMWTDEVRDLVVHKLHTKSAVLFGIESHVCVTQTALDLLRNDIAVYVLADGVSSMNKSEVKIAMERLRKAGATITSSESILFEMLVDSTHADFKAISGLVKTTKGTTTAALEVLGPNL